MENYEEDDDTHYCIKCHSTLSGLDNYVRHRQTGCRSSEVKSDVIPDPPSAAVSYPECLNADAFFSSLELQSSSKSKPCSSRTSLEPGRKSARSDEKRKKLRREYEEPSKEKLMNLPPVVTDLDDPTDHIGIPSLVGFPDIVTFSEKTTTVNPKLLSTVSKPPEKKGNDENRVWLEDTLDDLVGNKESDSTGLHSYSDLVAYQDDDSEDESSDDDIPDSYSDSDDQDDREYLPQAHTGGKWKPGQLLHEIAAPNDDELEDYHPDSPPSHTGGKWKPTEKADEEEQQQQQQQQEEGEEDDFEDTAVSRSREPPPGHTRGKWIPGASVGPSELNATGYWCSPCGRRLASKLLYNRHLKSDLHARRSIQEIDGDLKLPRAVGPLLRRKCRSKRQRVLALKRETKMTMSTMNKQTKTTRHREKAVLRCEMCHARVRRPQLGKHLLSHYHCRVAGLNPCNSTARCFILENMGNVVRQCPFQCSGCRFYCNTEETFLLHWRSQLHTNAQSDDGSHYTCACCDFRCESNGLMEEHLLSLEHREAVSMINGSVPVVIGRQRLLVCDTCRRHFRYNFQLRLHSKDTGHPESFTASDEYQRRITCNICSQIFRSLVSLQRHQLASHPSRDVSKGQAPAPYFCSFCSINFETARDAVLHRRTSSHKQTVKEHKFPGGVLLRRDCGHCGETLSDLREYKRHLLQHHRDLCHRCPQCGMIFALSQEVAKHTKNSECRPQIDPQLFASSEHWKCPSCPFIAESHSEYLFHQSLHSGCADSNSQEPSSSKNVQKYRCPVCDKVLPKETLRNHIRRHTGEKPFSCPKCGDSFAMRSALNIHIKSCKKKDSPAQTEKKKNRQRNYVCLECNAAFYTKHSLRQHMLRHAGKSYKCGFPGCPTVLRTANEHKTHRALIHESANTDRKFQCNECNYAGKTQTQLSRHQERHKAPSAENQLSCPYKDCNFVTRLGSHLRRHVRTHTGNKPYKCRHCTYASNNLENLRKHVLSTRLHPGKMIYECETCKENGLEIFCTNFSKELRAHLVEVHPQEFPTPGHANSHVSRMFGGTD